MPAALPDTASTKTGSPVAIDVLANDAGSNLTLVGVTEPAHGAVTPTAPGVLTYTPNPDFAGQDAFTYTVADANDVTAQVQVTVLVSPLSAPIGSNLDGLVTTIGTPIVVSVPVEDENGEPLNLVGVTSPSHGTIEVLPDQSIRYVPQDDFIGIDHFSYDITDTAGQTASSLVTLSVVTPNTAPVANDDIVVTSASTPIRIDMLADDTDPDSGPLRLSALTIPSHGGLIVNADQSVTYTPRSGYSGEDSFTYQIEDDRGGVATGTVNITVRSANEAPSVADDKVTTPAGTPVKIDILANDNDPEGKLLTLSALTLPQHGKLEMGENQCLLYTPNEGFVGSDTFTYQVKDPDEGHTGGEVIIKVTSPAEETRPSYPNGTAYRRRLVVPAQDEADAIISGFVMLVHERGDWLKPASAGGRIESADAADLCFELEDGTRLDHGIKRYDPTNGEMVAWVRLPTWDLSEQEQIYVYYGKTGATADPVRERAVWQDYLAVWDGQTGRDRTTTGRDLTLSGAIAGGELIGPCGRFDGTARASLDDVGFLDGLDAFSLQTFVDVDPASLGTDKGIISQGKISGLDEDQGFTLRFDAKGYDGGAANTLLWQVKTKAGSTRFEGPANAQRAGRMQVTGVWERGEPPRLYLDGVPVHPTNAPKSHDKAMVTRPGPLTLGAAAKDGVDGGWIGCIDDVRLRASVPSQTCIAIEHVSGMDPAAFYGLSGEERPDDPVAAPVAAPVRLSITSGNQIDVDVLDVAIVADGATPVLVTIGQAEHGAVSIVDGKICYTGSADYVGEDRFTYDISTNGKTATGTIVVVSRAAVPEPETEPQPEPKPEPQPEPKPEPQSPNMFYRPPAGLSAIEVNSDAAFEAALKRFKAGATNPLSAGASKIVVTGPLSERHTIKNIDTLSGPLVIEGAHQNLRSVASEGPIVSGGFVVSSPVWLHALRLANDRDDTLNTDKAAAPYRVALAPGSAGSKITHSFIRGQMGLGSGHPALSGTDAVPDISVAFCHFFTGKENRDGARQVFVALNNSRSYNQLPHRWTFYRNLFQKNDDINRGEDMMIYVAHGWVKNTDPDKDRTVVEDWLIEENMSIGNCARSIYYLKQVGSGTVIRRNHHAMDKSRGYATLRGNASSNVLVQGEWYEQLGTIYIQGINHRYEGCDFGNNVVNLACTGIYNRNHKIQEGATGLRMWGCKGGHFQLGSIAGNPSIVFKSALKDAVFEGLTDVQSWKDDNGKAVAWAADGSRIKSNHASIDTATLKNLPKTDRPITPRSTITRDDVGPGAA